MELFGLMAAQRTQNAEPNWSSAFRFTVHWDHEPRHRGAGRKAPINRTHSKRFALAESADRATAFGVRASSAPLSKACCDSVDGRFMESPLGLATVH